MSAQITRFPDKNVLYAWYSYRQAQQKGVHIYMDKREKLFYVTDISTDPLYRPKSTDAMFKGVICQPRHIASKPPHIVSKIKNIVPQNGRFWINLHADNKHA